MPLLGAGAGKTTLARTVAEVLGCPHVELAARHHGPGWTVRSESEDDVRRFTEGTAWGTEWHYAAVRDLLLDRADCLVWLDLPRALVTARVVRRNLRRRVRREVPWNGNTEPPLRTSLCDSDHIVRWAWRSRAGLPLPAGAQRRGGGGGGGERKSGLWGGCA